MREFTMADVLNQSWGGPSYAAYEGRSEDGVMDADARTDAAIAAFSGADNAADNADDKSDQNAGGAGEDAGQNDGQRQVDDKQQDGQEQPAQLTDEQLNADPRFQELSTFRDSVVNALSEFPGLVDDKGNVNVQEAGLQLKDGSVLYDIMQGKGTPSALLDLMAQNAGWTNEQKQAIAGDLVQWLTKNGYLKDGQAAAAAKKPGDPGFKDPVQERLDKLEKDRADEKTRAEQQKVQAHQDQVFRTKFLPEVERLCKQKGVPQEDFADYVARVAAEVKGNKAILGRIEKGNFVDVQKFFNQIYNAEAKRLERWTKAQTAAAEKKNKNPKIPAGGAPPQPAGSAKPNVRDRDSRIAAASEMF